MAESIDFLEREGLADEAERNFLISEELLADGSQSFHEIELILHEDDTSQLKEKNKLLKITIELQEIVKSLLKFQGILIDIKLKNIVERAQKCLEVLNKRSKSSDEILQIQKLVSILQELGANLSCTTGDKEINQPIQSIIQSAYSDILKFQKIYKNCVIFLENLFSRAKKEFKISNFPRNCQEYMCIILSTYAENLASYKIILALSKKTYEKFESLISKDLVSCKDCDYVISHYITAIFMASKVWRDLFSILYNIIGIE